MTALPGPHDHDRYATPVCDMRVIVNVICAVQPYPYAVDYIALQYYWTPRHRAGLVEDMRSADCTRCTTA